jgi:hypothetical protein
LGRSEIPVTDGDDHTTTYTCNDLNELTSVKNGDGDTTDSYDAEDHRFSSPLDRLENLVHNVHWTE